jgi:hypothetical protein
MLPLAASALFSSPTPPRLGSRIQENIKPLEGLLLVLPMFMEVGLEKGFCMDLGEFVIMQLQLAYVFFTFQLGVSG